MSNFYFIVVLLLLSVQFSSVTLSCPALCDPMNRSTPGLPVHHQLWSPPKLISIEMVMPSNHLLCPPFLLLPSIFPSIRVFPVSQLFTSGGQSIGSFSFNISPSNEHPGLISFRMDWLDLLAVQGTLKSLLQNHSSKASILQCYLFFLLLLLPWKTDPKHIAIIYVKECLPTFSSRSIKVSGLTFKS